MKSTIKIPDKIRVGYQNRDGTYTGQLAYVVYYDNKGKLRKETSFNSWRNKDIEANDFKNEPTEGFVLNKKAGGYSTGWNHRQTYVRVYDPRNFEFEISVPNLLFILENTNSIKGKGLEGKFVYGWDGKDLVLIPCDSPDYVELSKYNDKVKSNNYKGKDMKIGATYLNKNNQEVVYIGRFAYYGGNKQKKAYYFYSRDKEYTWEEGAGYFINVSSVGQYIIDIVSETCVSDYADIFDKFEYYEIYNPYDKTKDEYINHTLESFTNYVNSHNKHPEEDYKYRNYESIYYASEDIDEEEYIYTGWSGRDKETRLRALSKYYDFKRKLFFWEVNSYDGWRTSRQEITMTMEEFFNEYKPQWKKEYLLDGKLRRVRYYDKK